MNAGSCSCEFCVWTPGLSLKEICRLPAFLLDFHCSEIVIMDIQSLLIYNTQMKQVTLSMLKKEVLFFSTI